MSQSQAKSIQVENKFRREFEVVKEVEDRKEHYRYVVEAEFEAGTSGMLGSISSGTLSTPMATISEKVLVISEEDGDIVIERYTVRMSWDGTGRDDIGKIVVKDVFEESPYIVWREFYEEIETHEDFEQKVKEVVDFVKEYADDLNPLKD